MKLHLGCGQKYIKGFKHIDQIFYDHIDWVAPIYPLPFIDDNSVQEIYSSHALEYFDFHQAYNVLCEWKRCLKKEGILRLSVPDFDKLLKVYNKEQLNIDKIIGPLFGRWPINENEFTYHKTVFTKQKLIQLLKSSGFSEIGNWDPFEFFGGSDKSYDDYSKAYYPHMDFDNGFSICVNLIAKNYDK